MFIIPSKSRMSVSPQVTGPDPGIVRTSEVAVKSSGAVSQPSELIFLDTIQKNVKNLVQSMNAYMVIPMNLTTPEALKPNDYIYNIDSNLRAFMSMKSLPSTVQSQTTILNPDFPVLQSINKNMQTLLNSYPSSSPPYVETLSVNAVPIDYYININTMVKRILELEPKPGAAPITYVNPYTETVAKVAENVSLASGAKKRGAVVSWRRIKEIEARIGDLEAAGSTFSSNNEHHNEENSSYYGGGRSIKRSKSKTRRMKRVKRSKPARKMTRRLN